MINTSIHQPHITTENGQRRFACSPAAVQAYIFNRDEELLLLKHPARDGWEVVNGALEAGETVLDGMLREISEEAGPQVIVRPLGAIHISSFHYDKNVHFMLSLHYLFEYKDGRIETGDDMRGSQHRWWPVEKIIPDDFKLLVPVSGKWLVKRSLELYQIWRIQPPVELQRGLEPKANKNLT